MVDIYLYFYFDILGQTFMKMKKDISVYTFNEI